MDINAMFPSTYLKKEDFESPALLTMRGVKSEDVAPQGQAEEYKPVLYFKEREQGLVLNRTNAQAIVEMYGPETDNWPGKPVVVYNDPNIMYAGKRTGGIRLRKPKNQPAPAPMPMPAGDPLDDMGDDIPFANPYRGMRSLVV